MKQFRVFVLLVFVGMFSAGCTTVEHSTKGDPLESMNRSVHQFNEGFDRAVAKPVSKKYVQYVATEFRTCVANFFANLDDVTNAVNNALQGKFKSALNDTCRVLINTTVGFLGLVDPASDFGFQKHDEDFGQTLGYWGVGPAPYLVLPFFGPSTFRDLAGRVVDGSYSPLGNHEPINERNVATAIDAVDSRARLLPTTDLVDRIALDKYSFVRDAYLANRKSLIRNGQVSDDEYEPESNLED